MAKANQLMNPFLPRSAVTQALLSLSSAKSRAGGGGRGMFGKVVAAERLPWRCCRMLS